MVEQQDAEDEVERDADDEGWCDGASSSWLVLMPRMVVWQTVHPSNPRVFVNNGHYAGFLCVSVIIQDQTLLERNPFPSAGDQNHQNRQLHQMQIIQAMMVQCVQGRR